MARTLRPARCTAARVPPAAVCSLCSAWPSSFQASLSAEPVCTGILHPRYVSIEVPCACIPLHVFCQFWKMSFSAMFLSSCANVSHVYRTSARGSQEIIWVKRRCSVSWSKTVGGGGIINEYTLLAWIMVEVLKIQDVGLSFTCSGRVFQATWRCCAVLGSF